MNMYCFDCPAGPRFRREHHRGPFFGYLPSPESWDSGGTANHTTLHTSCLLCDGLAINTVLTHESAEPTYQRNWSRDEHKT